MENSASHYALRVALQTMKERCQTLQQRLMAVEIENIELKLKCDTKITTPTTKIVKKTDLIELNEKISELTRQKLQLTDHIAMVATENRQLWSRLSKLTKDNEQLGTKIIKMQDSISPENINSTTNNGSGGGVGGNTTNNLIRSKTFTQNSPNPALRQRINIVPSTHSPLSSSSTNDTAAAAVAAATPVENTNLSDIDKLSLEEISLKVLNEFLEGKAGVEKECDELINVNDINSFGFGFLNDSSTIDTNEIASRADSVPIFDDKLQIDMKICSNIMQTLKNELLKQQSDIKVALSSLRQKHKLDKEKNDEGKKKSTFIGGVQNFNKESTVDKSTARIINEIKDNDELLYRTSSSNVKNNTTLGTTTTVAAAATTTAANDLMQTTITGSSSSSSNRIDISEEKRKADFIDKMCPICGQIYYSNLNTFDQFQDHVESHFIDDTELDQSIDLNFEIISHTVGNF